MGGRQRRAAAGPARRPGGVGDRAAGGTRPPAVRPDRPLSPRRFRFWGPQGPRSRLRLGGLAVLARCAPGASKPRHSPQDLGTPTTARRSTPAPARVRAIDTRTSIPHARRPSPSRDLGPDYRRDSVPRSRSGGEQSTPGRRSHTRRHKVPHPDTSRPDSLSPLDAPSGLDAATPRDPRRPEPRHFQGPRHLDYRRAFDPRSRSSESNRRQDVDPAHPTAQSARIAQPARRPQRASTLRRLGPPPTPEPRHSQDLGPDYRRAFDPRTRSGESNRRQDVDPAHPTRAEAPQYNPDPVPPTVSAPRLVETPAPSRKGSHAP